MTQRTIADRAGDAYQGITVAEHEVIMIIDQFGKRKDMSDKVEALKQALFHINEACEALTRAEVFPPGGGFPAGASKRSA